MPPQSANLSPLQLDVTDDGFLSLMSEDGSTKDDVKVPDGETGEKINKLFNEESKDTSKFPSAEKYKTGPHYLARRDI